MLMDPHIHLHDLSYGELELVALAGIGEVVSPINFRSARPVPASTIRDIWDFHLESQLPRATEFSVKAYAMIGISMVSIPRDPENLLDALPEYLERPDVVALGEIGFEPTSRVCPDLKRQEEVFRAQLEVAGRLNVPVVIHTPQPREFKSRYTELSLQLVREAGLDLSKVVIDHCSPETVGTVLAAGAKAAVTIQPWRGTSAETAVTILERFGCQDLWFNSDASAKGASDPVAMARVALALARAGFPREEIVKVCWSNAREFYGIA